MAEVLAGGLFGIVLVRNLWAVVPVCLSPRSAYFRNILDIMHNVSVLPTGEETPIHCDNDAGFR